MFEKFHALRKPIAFEQSIGARAINLAGYGLLAMFLCSTVELAGTAGLMNPAWEFQASGRITDSSWALLLGMALVFRRDAGQEFPALELALLKCLSRACVLFAFGYVLLIAVIYNAAGRLQSLDVAQAQQAVQVVDRQADMLRSAVSQAESLEALQRMLPAGENNAAALLPAKSIDALKAELTERVRTQQRDNTSRLLAELKSRDSNRFWLKLRMCAHSLIIAVLSLLLLFRSKEVKV